MLVHLEPLGITSEERDQLQAFLLALDGRGADASLREPPALP
jgi:hypothetical protein